VSIHSRGHAPYRSGRIALAPGLEAVHDIVLEPEATIAGRVLDDDKTPLAWAGITTSIPGDGIPAQELCTVSDQDGEYRVGGLKSGTYKLWAHKGGYATQVREGVSTGRTDADFLLARAGELRGSVKDAVTGAFVSDFTVEAVAESEDLRIRGGKRVRAFKDPDGSFELGGLPVGPYRVLITATGWLPQESAVELEPGEVSQVDVALHRGARITGNVVNARGEPVAGAELGILVLAAKGLDGAGASQGVWAAAGTSGTDGAFEISGLLDGLYQVQAAHAGYAPALSVPAVAGLEPGVPVPELKIVLESN
jgi:hypothetical protein